VNTPMSFLCAYYMQACSTLSKGDGFSSDFVGKAEFTGIGWTGNQIKTFLVDEGYAKEEDVEIVNFLTAAIPIDGHLTTGFSMSTTFYVVPYDGKSVGPCDALRAEILTRSKTKQRPLSSRDATFFLMQQSGRKC